MLAGFLFLVLLYANFRFRAVNVSFLRAPQIHFLLNFFAVHGIAQFFFL